MHTILISIYCGRTILEARKKTEMRFLLVKLWSIYVHVRRSEAGRGV